MEELIRLGAYKVGSNPEVDESIKLFPLLDEFLRQGKKESTSMSDSYIRLAEIMAAPRGAKARRMRLPLRHRPTRSAER
jgi:flagellar biosynthesis/type III secretory pathway ATPase